MQESTKLNYVEFASLDIPRSKAFFESAFGWSFTDYGSEYSAFSNAGMDGGIFSAQRVMKAESGAPLLVLYSNNISESVKNADIVVTTTPSTEPILKAEWLQPGVHVTAMGSDQHTKNELEPECLKIADLYVSDSISQTIKQGELRTALDAKIISSYENFPELGEIINGTVQGRTTSEAITIVDLTGTGVQDTAIATYAFQRSVELGNGKIFVN